MADKMIILGNVLASISGSPGVYAYRKPKNDDACIVYKMISDPKAHNHSGSEINPSRFQLDVYGTDLVTNRALADRVVRKLDCNKSDFELAIVVGDIPVFDQESGLYRSIVDVMIW